MSIARRAALDAEIRQRLVDAAVREFSEHGFHGASLNRILHEVSISKGQFYYHYRGKTGLLRALVADLVVDARAAVGPSGPAPRTAEEFWAQREDGYRRVVDFFVQRPDRAALALLISQLYNRPEFVRDLSDFRTESEAYLQKKVEEGQRLGAVRTDVPASLLVAASGAVLEATDVWMARELASSSPEELIRTCRSVFALVRRMCSPEANGRRQPGRRRALRG